MKKPFLLVLTTGGTIDKRYPRRAGAYAFEFDGPAVKRILESIDPDFDYKVVEVCALDSEEIKQEHRDLLVRLCSARTGGRILVTHGTDTMLETAENLLKAGIEAAIVLTGATLPERNRDTDAWFNIGVACCAALELCQGVYVAIRGRVYPWYEVTRDKQGRFVEKSYG